MSVRHERGRDVRLPPESFYWAVLDTSALPGRAAGRHDQLGYLFESVLPMPTEDVQAVYAARGGGGVVACGMERARLEGLCGPGVLTLGPGEAPPFVGECPDVRRFNLLHGAHEPREIGRARGRLTAVCAAAILVCTLVVLGGQQRRVGSLDRQTRAWFGATASVHGRVLPARPSVLPPAARLTAERRELERTRGARHTERGVGDAGATLAAVLGAWPDGLHVETEALGVSETAITLTARVPDSAAAERLERELTPPEGWRMAQPDVRADRGGVVVRARMEPAR